MLQPIEQNPPLRAFISFSSEDDAHRIALEKHLMILQRQGLLETWNFRKILPGSQWREEEDLAMATAEIVIALVSANFLASDYCYQVEMQKAIARDQAGEARLLPVIVSPCLWRTSPLGEYQALPKQGEPITQWTDAEAAWANVAQSISALIAQVYASGTAEKASAARAASGEPEYQRYAQALQQRNGYVEIRGMGAQVNERLPLDQVYTRLQVAGSGREGDRKRGPKQAGEGRSGDSPRLSKHEAHGGLGPNRHQDLAQILAWHPHVALIGDPGSGKTTFLRFVAQMLARSLLGDEGALARVGLKGKTLFPLLVRLERLADFLLENPDADCEDDAVAHFLRYLDHHQSGRAYGLPPGYLRKRLRAGGCFVMLDGLDEVPGEALRKRLSRLMENVIEVGQQDGKDGNRHLFTCRTRAYEGFVRVAGDIVTAQLAPFGTPEVAQFVGAWSGALFRASESPQAKADAQAYAGELLGAIRANPEGHRFAASPLMLTVLAVVHWNRRKLPEQRVELYQAALEYLFESRDQLAEHPATLRRECLQAVALAMFTDEEGVQRSFGREEAARAVLPVLGCDSLEEAVVFVEAEELYSGVLVSRAEGEVEFWHLMFQEYLAALELSNDEDCWALIAPKLHDDRWSEVVLLLAGCRRKAGLRSARKMLQRVLKTGQDAVSNARAVALAGRILRDIAPYGGDAASGTDYAAMLRDTLAIFEPDGAAVEEPVRIEVGEALGRAGDPRLANPDHNQVLVRAGSFLMGAQAEAPGEPGYDKEAYGDEEPVRRITITEDLRVGRYPVTVAEFAEFVRAGAEGYLDPRLWTPEGWGWRENAAIAGPKGWTEQKHRGNSPVVGVSWYEADAYARWVRGSLPSEAQWEWIARGAGARRYPWGQDTPTAQHASFDGRNERPSPIGIYGAGRTPEGVCDLAGNVLEWCADYWADRYDIDQCMDPAGPPESGGRVLRGGAFYDRAHYLRAADRYSSPPGSRDSAVGFRVVWRLPRGQT